MVFSPVEITQSEQISLDVKNTGTLPATISNIGIQQTGGPFSLSGQPPLPVTLAPNADFQITITFTPTTLGYSNASLLFDTTTIALQGSGTQPPPLPSYTISGPSGNVAPMTQPTIGLTLASPYPVAISGTLTLSVTGTLPADQAVQFLTGGSTVSFTIPANQTSAVFGAQGTQLGLQTGTVASTITITPSFVTQAGNVPLTPATPEVLQFSRCACRARVDRPPTHGRVHDRSSHRAIHEHEQLHNSGDRFHDNAVPDVRSGAVRHRPGILHAHFSVHDQRESDLHSLVREHRLQHFRQSIHDINSVHIPRCGAYGPIGAERHRICLRHDEQRGRVLPILLQAALQ